MIASVYNCANIKNIYGLLKGSYNTTERYGLWDEKNIHYFTGESIMVLFQQCGYEIRDITYTENVLSPEEEEVIKLTERMEDRTSEELLRAYNYIVIAGRG